MTIVKHILVIDDDDRLRGLLQQYLSEHGFMVSTATTADDARKKLASLDFDLLVLDIMMPGETGLEFTKSLRKSSNVPILLLTAMGETETRIEGLENGADDYLVKPFEPKELMLRINSILRRSGAPEGISQGVTRLGDVQFDLERELLLRGEEVIPLTSTERQLLKTLASHPGTVFSREDLVELSDGESTRTVDVQVTRLRRKIEADPRNPRYIHTVRGKGYVLRGD